MTEIGAPCAASLNCTAKNKTAAETFNYRSIFKQDKIFQKKDM